MDNELRVALRERIRQERIKRRRNGEVPRADFRTWQRTVPILCRGIGALAMYVQTVDGMKWRCNRCGGQVKVVA